MALTSASLPAKKRILTVCVKLFLEKGYKKATLAEIIEKADVSYSTFQNIFRAKDGVLTELVKFMFENQFAMARSEAGAKLPPVYVYAVETAIQMTLTELNENLREIYIEAYTQQEASEYIFRETARELHQIFGPYQPELTAQDFYYMEIGSASIMRGYMAQHRHDGRQRRGVDAQGPGGDDGRQHIQHRLYSGEGDLPQPVVQLLDAVQKPCHQLHHQMHHHQTDQQRQDGRQDMPQGEPAQGC